MMNRVLTQLRETGVNPRLDIFGVVMTMFDGRTKLSNEVVGEVRNLLGARYLKRSFRAARAWPRRPASASRSFTTTNTVPARRRINCWRRKFSSDWTPAGVDEVPEWSPQYFQLLFKKEQNKLSYARPLAPRLIAIERRSHWRKCCGMEHW